MGIDQDLEKIAAQEKWLQFESFNAETAWAIGSALRVAARERRAAIAVDIQINGHTLFSCAMQGTSPDNQEWIRRKRNLVQRYHRSSYAIGLRLERDKTTLQEKLHLDAKDYAVHGGCFPIFLKDTGCVGTITVSGLPQREDHNLIVSVLQGFLGISNENLGLDAGSAQAAGK